MARAYVDNWEEQIPDKTICVHEEPRSAIIRYPKPNGGVFKVKVVQKPNPVGFHARLPGGKPKK